jgi:glycosyltransferase involved in cell wall biosynthesis
MRVVWLTTDLTSPAVRFRVLIYQKLFEQAGVEMVVIPCDPPFYAEPVRWRNPLGYHSLNLRKILSRWKAFGQIRPGDIVILQRELVPYNSAFLEKSLRKRAGVLLLDWDDAVYLNYSQPDSPTSKMAQICGMVDMALCGNAVLKEYSERFGARTTILPTPVEEDPDFSVAQREEVHRFGRPFVIGWTGSTGTLGCIRELAGVILRLQERYPGLEVKVMSNWHDDRSQPDLGFPYEFVRWNPQVERATVRSFSCGLMPLADTPFNRGKCSLKLLQYMAAGVPAIGSPVGNNTEVIQHGVNGYHATTDQEWFERISSLIESTKDCLRLGLAGRKTLEEKYSLQVCGNRLLSLLKEYDGGA